MPRPLTHDRQMVCDTARSNLLDQVCHVEVVEAQLSQLARLAGHGRPLGHQGRGRTGGQAEGQRHFPDRFDVVITCLCLTRWQVYWDGKRAPGYAPMKKQGSIILGIGGDNSDGAVGTFYEGVITRGYTSDEADDQVQANIVAAGYKLLE